jgi:hypothetical protein
MPATNLLLKPEQDRKLYALYYRVRTAATADGDAVQRAKQRGLERMIHDLDRRGWVFVAADPVPMSGPYPVVPRKGFGRRPNIPKRKPRQPSPRFAPPDDYTWRISTLPQITHQTARFLTDEVEWEFAATFHRPALPTAYEVPEEGNPQKLWQPRSRRPNPTP